MLSASSMTTWASWDRYQAARAWETSTQRSGRTGVGWNDCFSRLVQRVDKRGGHRAWRRAGDIYAANDDL